MTSVSTPKDQAREDERVEKQSLSNSDRLRVATSYHREKLPPGFAQELFDFADEWDDELEAVSVSPSPADPVRAALEEARAGFEEWFTRSNLGADLRGITACAFHDAWRAALATLSNPPGRQGEEEGLRRACVPDVPASDHCDYLGEVVAQYVTNVGVLADVGGAIDAIRAALVHPPQEGGRALADIAAERRRQVDTKGWTPEHDDNHDKCELARAAACYALAPSPVGIEREWIYPGSPKGWPWSGTWWKPGFYRRNLVKAGALLVAEIERWDRLTNAPAAPTPSPAVPGSGEEASPCHWGGGNDIIWCSTCGAEYAYAKGEQRPACPRRLGEEA